MSPIIVRGVLLFLFELARQAYIKHGQLTVSRCCYVRVHTRAGWLFATASLGYVRVVGELTDAMRCDAMRCDAMQE